VLSGYYIRNNAVSDIYKILKIGLSNAINLNKMKTNLAIILVLFLAVLFSCEKEDDERQLDLNYNPGINPENFTDSVTNVFFPLSPGIVFTYKSQAEDGLETIVVTVLSDKRIVAGVNCTVVRDVVSIAGQVIEDTYDWYAQDKDGNIWYMGENVSNYENGVFVDNEGSFEAGIDGAKPGILMMANPILEMPYRQEYYFNIAEDWGKVIAKGVSVTTTYGTFNNCLKTADWNALEPDAPIEYKYYAPNVGLVKEEIEGSSENVDLISIK
jgi:hypothetical protein